ncbi:MAG: hypothetical protein Q9174_004894, partial [Haloplaca sp. 1 TL-2023]
SSQRLCVTSLFEAVVKLNRDRIRSRLSPEHGRVPQKKAMMLQHLRALVPPLRQDFTTKELGDRLEELSDTYEKASRSPLNGVEELQLLQQAVKCSHYLCILMDSVTNQPWSSKYVDSKWIETVRKLGRYYGLCIFLAKMTRLYPELFNNLTLRVPKPYKTVRTTVSNQVTSKQPAVYCLVHAEIQLIVFYDSQSSEVIQRPRALGVCKSACFLCDLFISLHDKYHISHTHGRLYDLWTLPDLKEYTPVQRRQYQNIIQAMNRKCAAILANPPSHVPQCPAESKCDLHEALSSIATTIVASDSSQITIRGLTPAVEDGLRIVDLDARGSAPVKGGFSQPGDGARGEEGPSSPTSATNYTPRPSPQTNTEHLERSVQSFTKASNDEHGVLDSSSGLQAQNESGETPRSHQVNHLDPLYLQVDGIHLDFEAEEPTEGKITLGMLPGHANPSAHTVNIDTLEPGQDIVLLRDYETPILHIHLLRNRHPPTEIHIEWLPR